MKSMVDVIDALNQISEAPAETADFNAWLKMEQQLAFLLENISANEFVVYAINRSTFIHSLLVPTSLVSPPDMDDLMLWECGAAVSWTVDFTYSEPDSLTLVPPVRDTRSRTLDKGEQLVFARSFEGRLGKKTYHEILQKFTYAFELHYIEERSAYCRLDKQGDIEEIIRIVTTDAKGDDFDSTVITINREILDEYLTVTNSTVARTFDFTHHRPDQFTGWPHKHPEERYDSPDIAYRLLIEPGYASYMRGVQVVSSSMTKDEVLKRHDHKTEEERQYVSFIAEDWKNKAVAEISCAPDATASYFEPSALPFELTPAFFKPDVLMKYKANSEKYKISGRSIYCRGAWRLRSFDINEAGQVNAYLIDLRDLPYEEQLYWKSYNEEPKGSISSRAFTTDFEGNWSSEYDSLDRLKNTFAEWHSAQVPWWKLRANNLIDKLHYPLTSSPDEWADELLHLDQLLVEGFEARWLRTKAGSLGRTPDEKFGSLKLIEECLLGLGVEDGDARTTVAPLRRVRELRTKMKGHAGDKEATLIKKQTLAEYKTYKRHFEATCVLCDESTKVIAACFEQRS
jgi:hypothetical protein